MLLLVLEIDATYTSFIGHCARKSALLVLVRCCKARSDREHDLWRNWQPEAALSSGMSSIQVMNVSARSMSWGSNEAVSLLYLVLWPSTST